MTDFSTIASHYRDTSTAQQSAAERLFELLDLRPDEAVLDLGCGTGHLTAAAYLNPACYDGELPEDYFAVAHEVIAGDFRRQAGPDRLVDLSISRVYLPARAS